MMNSLNGAKKNSIDKRKIIKFVIFIKKISISLKNVKNQNMVFPTHFS